MLVVTLPLATSRITVSVDLRTGTTHTQTFTAPFSPILVGSAAHCMVRVAGAEAVHARIVVDAAASVALGDEQQLEIGRARITIVAR